MEQLKTITIQNTWTNTYSYWTNQQNIINVGWGNGYVIIPKWHELFGKNYDDINEYKEINIHGGLTFSCEIDTHIYLKFKLSSTDLGKWIVGFDTCHYGDNDIKWSKENVEKETKKLLKQIEKIKSIKQIRSEKLKKIWTG